MNEQKKRKFLIHMLSLHYFTPTLFVYRKGDIVKQPMKKGSFVPKNVPGVGWGGVGWGGVGWVM